MDKLTSAAVLHAIGKATVDHCLRVSNPVGSPCVLKRNRAVIADFVAKFTSVRNTCGGVER